MTKSLPAATATSRIESRAVRSSAQLESWVERAWSDGVQVDALRDLDVLRVRTMNTVYEITLVTARDGDALVRGGRFFPEAARAVILGSSLGGAFLKLRGIYCGFSLELFAIGVRIVTSSVQSVQLVDDHRTGHVQ